MPGNVSYPWRVKDVPNSVLDWVRWYRQNDSKGRIIIEEIGGPYFNVECEEEVDGNVIKIRALLG